MHLKSNKFSENGVAGAVCARHGMPLSFLSIGKTGESFEYGRSIAEELCRSFDKIVWSYDLSCKFYKSTAQLSWASKIEAYAIPKLHMYVHDESCRKNFNLLHIKGIGNVDGEEIERFWSFLGPFGTFVREMTASNRKDFLSIIIIKYALRKLFNLVNILFAKYKKASEWIEEYSELVDRVEENIKEHKEHAIPKSNVQSYDDSNQNDGAQIRKMYLRSVVKYHLQSNPDSRKNLLTVVKRYERVYKFERHVLDSPEYCMALKEMQTEERQGLKDEIDVCVNEIAFLQEIQGNPKFQKGQTILQLGKKMEAKNKQKANSLIKKYNEQANKSLKLTDLLKDAKSNKKLSAEFRLDLISRRKSFEEEKLRIPKEISSLKNYFNNILFNAPKNIISCGGFDWNFFCERLILL
jgi:hypothetical protein